MGIHDSIALSPDLGISPTEFVAAWNTDPETFQAGTASLSTSPSIGYDFALLAGALISIPTGMAVNTLYDLIKNLLIKKGVQKHTHIEAQQKPDGTRLVVIDITE